MSDRIVGYTSQEYYRAGVRAHLAGKGYEACPAVNAACDDAGWWRKGFTDAQAGRAEAIDTSNDTPWRHIARGSWNKGKCAAEQFADGGL